MTESRKSRNGFLFLVVALVLSAMLYAGPAFAETQPIPDTSRTGSATFSLVTNSGKAEAGATLYLYKIGEVSVDDGNYSWVLTPKFASSGVDLTDISDPAIADALAPIAKKTTANATVTTNSKGKVSATGLPVGAYLVVQKKAVEGFAVMTPFVFTIPMYEKSAGSESTYGTYIYDINAEPKVLPVGEVKGEDDDPDPDPDNGGGNNNGNNSNSGTNGESTLPQTGQLWWPVPVLLVLGAAFIAFGAFRTRRNRSGE